MNSETLYWWLSLLGSMASLIGLPVAIQQIAKTRRAAEAATAASLKTRKDISRNLFTFEILICTRNLEEVKSFVQSERFDAALIRINDSIAQLIQIQELLRISHQNHQIEFIERLSQLSVIRKSFEKKIADGSARIDTVKVKSQLSEVCDDLNKLVGENKIFIEEGE